MPHGRHAGRDPHTAPPRPSRLRAAAVALALAPAPLAGPAQAQPAADTADPAPAWREVLGRDLFDGRTFGGVGVAAPVRELDLALAADRAWAWRDRDTHRLFLDRDVRVAIGPFSFAADRAAIWIERVTVARPDGSVRDAEQLAIYFDDVRDPGGPPGIAQSGERLLVTGLLTSADDPALRVDLLERGRPFDPFVEEAEARLARHLERITGLGAAAPSAARAAVIELPRRAGEPPRLVRRAPADPEPTGAALTGEPADPRAAATRREPLAIPPVVRRSGRVAPGAPGADPDSPVLRDDALFARGVVIDDRPPLPPAERLPVRRPGATDADPGVAVSFEVGQAEEIRGDAGDLRARIVSRGVAVQVAAPGRERPVQLTAQRGVVFYDDPERPDDETGVYVEGDVVVTDGSYTLRGRRVFYDLATDRAVVLDGVFFTYDTARGMPLYLRADVIRQRALDEWTAQDVTLANFSFAEPHFSIGVTDLTLRRDEGAGPGGRDRYEIDARGVGFEAAGVPLVGVPRARGEVRTSPLRSLGFESEGGSAVVRTVWDAFLLTGQDPPEGNRADLLIDGYIERGPGLGADLEWARGGLTGSAFGYWVWDHGEDRLTSGAEIDRDDEHRGIFLLDNRWSLSDRWTLFLESAWISDEAFVDAFFEDLAEERREFINSAYLRWATGNQLFSIEGRGTLNDFIANEYLLQSQGYVVERLPEARYAIVGQDLGPLAYTGDTRLSRLELQFSEVTLESQGFDNDRRAGAGFGLAPQDRLADVLDAAGIPAGEVLRADSRHTVELPLTWGPLNVVPFATGRVTAYDTEFDDLRGPDGPDDQYRLWGAAGVRLDTSLVRTNDAARSELFDVRRLRHIVEPSVTVWSAGTSIESDQFPVYDRSVERIADGTVVRLGLRNTWQTKRGRGRNERSVDWIIIDAEYVWSSADAPEFSPFGRFVWYRPELSNLGEFIHADAAMRLTDAVTLVGDFRQDTDDNRLATASGGFQIDHGLGFSTFAEARYLHGFDNTFLTAGARYELTRKYAMEVDGTYDFDDDELQGAGAAVVRRFPQWTFRLRVALDNITDDVGVGVSIRPVGFGGERRDRVFTGAETEAAFGANTDDNTTRPGRITSGPFR